MFKRVASVIVLLLAAGNVEAALFLPGAPVFSTAPWSQLGPVTNNLVVTNTANGFVVSGQVLINVPAGNVGGILVAWTVDRALDPTYGSAPLSTSTVLTGFSQPPIGAFQNTAGLTQSQITSFPGPSTSNIPLSLTAGAATWTSLSSNSSTFTYTAGGTEYLRQTFMLDGLQFAGPGGTWIVDVPLETSINVVPEPSTLLLSASGVAIAVACVGRRKLCKTSKR